jgi:hypothetical protein
MNQLPRRDGNRNCKMKWTTNMEPGPRMKKVVRHSAILIDHRASIKIFFMGEFMDVFRGQFEDFLRGI